MYTIWSPNEYLSEWLSGKKWRFYIFLNAEMAIFMSQILLNELQSHVLLWFGKPLEVGFRSSGKINGFGMIIVRRHTIGVSLRTYFCLFSFTYLTHVLIVLGIGYQARNSCQEDLNRTLTSKESSAWCVRFYEAAYSVAVMFITSWLVIYIYVALLRLRLNK